MAEAATSALSRTLKQFRDFALKGNVVDLAFAVIIGAAFAKVVDSLVKDIIMPIIGMVGSADFSNYFLPLSRNVTATNLADAQKQGPVLAWGSFATYVVNFVIVAAALFLLFKVISNLKNRLAHEVPAEVLPTRQEVLLAEIRDLLARDRI
ncbi:large conductance mechanosensitive channel protein MscL [Lichenibacterium ramalinae]|uniref:Large-conductance mechanosensitive channel n=1 Tax=Lichenibacterium ramalinae TaxID=2316527 RepID=A0A4Q2RGJ4_9HYPH|nr:large conductance mechanosensitive channel protein MscL [Lichenibacterium ramalinae]RYB07083.1 large conductance mechanosensitive channel protein MscL [Lichenibacterium ramalinae]